MVFSNSETSGLKPKTANYAVSMLLKRNPALSKAVVMYRTGRSNSGAYAPEDMVRKFAQLIQKKHLWHASEQSNAAPVDAVDASVASNAQLLITDHLSESDVSTQLSHLLQRPVPFKLRVTPNNELALIDIAIIFTGLDNKHATQAVRRLLDQFPDIASTRSKFKFPGRGRQTIDVAPLAEAIEFAFLLPGHAASKVCKEIAKLLVRYIGGDLSLVDEICTINRAQAAMTGIPEECAAELVPAHPIVVEASDQGNPEQNWSDENISIRTFKGLMIERRVSDGYFNGTAICTAFRKKFDNYLQAQRVSEYLNALAHSLLSKSGIPDLDFETLRASLVQVQHGGPTRGSWIHERMAVDLSRWLSPDFAVWMDGWLLETMGASHTYAATSSPTTPSDAVDASDASNAQLLITDHLSESNVSAQLSILLQRPVQLRLRIMPNKEVALIDIAIIFTGLDNDNAGKAVRRLLEQFQDIRSNSPKFKFPGRGRQTVDVAPLADALEFAFLLPGRAASKVRKEAAKLLVRYIGGDLSIVDEVCQINRVHVALVKIPEDERTAEQRTARIFGETVENTTTQLTHVPASEKEPLKILPLPDGLISSFNQRDAYVMRITDQNDPSASIWKLAVATIPWQELFLYALKSSEIAVGTGNMMYRPSATCMNRTKIYEKQ